MTSVVGDDVLSWLWEGGGACSLTPGAGGGREGVLRILCSLLNVELFKTSPLSSNSSTDAPRILQKCTDVSHSEIGDNTTDDNMWCSSDFPKTRRNISSASRSMTPENAKMSKRFTVPTATRWTDLVIVVKLDDRWDHGVRRKSSSAVSKHNSLFVILTHCTGFMQPSLRG